MLHFGTWFIFMTILLASNSLNTPPVLDDVQVIQEVVAIADSTISLICDTELDDFDSITWWRNDSANVVAKRTKDEPDYFDGNYTSRLEFNKKNLILSSCKVQDRAFYYCETTNNDDLLSGPYIKLTVEENPYCLMTTTKVEAANGTSAAIPCKVRGYPPPVITWINLDSKKTLDKERFVVTKNGLTITKTEVYDSGRYQVTLRNKLSTKTYITTLKVISTKSVKPDNYIVVTEHQIATVACGKRPAKEGDTIKWLRNGIDVIGSEERFSKDKNGSLVIRNALHADTGLYQCASIRRTPDGELTISVSMFLNVRYAPSINYILPVVIVYKGRNAMLPCSASGNPSVSFRWLYPEGARITKTEKFEIITNGSLSIRDAKIHDTGNYTCAPFNEIGDGHYGYTYLKVYNPPKFHNDPKNIKTEVNQNVTLDCSAYGIPTPNVTWSRNHDLPFDRKRVVFNAVGLLVIRNVKGSDSGSYKCIVSSDAGEISRTLKLQVIGKPGSPQITEITSRDSVAYVIWQPSFDGGSQQMFQFWYLPTHLNEYNWQTFTSVMNYSGGKNSIDIPLTGPAQVNGKDVAYWLSIRSKNEVGYSEFGDVFKVLRSSKKGEMVKATRTGSFGSVPLSPYGFIVNITKNGYALKWKHVLTPGRPAVKSFVIQYRSQNSSVSWQSKTISKRSRRSLEETRPVNSEVFLSAKDFADVKHPLQFKLAAMGPDGEQSPFIGPEKEYITGMPGTVSPTTKSEDSNMLAPIVLGCIFGVFVIVLLISLLCFCQRRKQRRYQASKNEKKIVYNVEQGVDAHGHFDDVTDSVKLLSPKFGQSDSPRRFHLRNCPALKLGKYDSLSNGTMKDDVYVLFEANENEQHVCTCNKKYLTLNSKDQKSKREKKKGLYKSTSSPSVLLASDIDVSSVDPSELLDEEDYDISDVEKDVVVELNKDSQRFASLNRKNFKDSYDQFCNGDDGFRRRLSSVEKTEADKNLEVLHKAKDADASSENSLTESDRIATPREKSHKITDSKLHDSNKSSGFGDGSNSTSDSESVSAELLDKPMLLRPNTYTYGGYVSDTGRRDPGYASDISTRSSPLDYLGRHKYLPPSQRHNFTYNHSHRAPPHVNYYSEDEAVSNGYGRPVKPPSYNQAMVDIERLSEKNDITDSEEMFGNLLEMERQMGVHLDDSLDSDLNIKTKMPAMVPPPPTRPFSNPRFFGPDTGYTSDAQYSDREKTARCKQLLNEFKSNRNGSSKYTDDELDEEDEVPIHPPPSRCRSVMDDMKDDSQEASPSLKRSNSVGASSIYKEWLV